jgi:molecular chaperone Hsp33
MVLHMEKKPVQDQVVREHLDSLPADGIDIFLLEHGALRGAAVHGTTMVNEMRTNHELGILETLTLGHAYLGTALMTGMVKGNDRISMQVECGGPIQGLVAEGRATGGIRGYLKNVPIPLEEPPESFDLSPFFGAGFLTVTKELESAKQPFSGQVILKYGNIGEDLAYYFTVSEQVPSAFSLSIRFDKEGRVIGAGGLFLQVLGGSEEATIDHAQQALLQAPVISDYFAAGGEASGLISTAFADFAPDIIATREVAFHCDCSKERFGAFLASMKREEREDILANGPFPLRTTCYNCNTQYQFSRREIEELFSN